MFRHRGTFIWLSSIFGGVLIALYVAYRVDVFPNDDPKVVHASVIELDEALAIAALTALALFAFAVRQYLISKKEIRARVAAERRARELAYQDGLTGLPNRRQYEELLAAAVASPPRAGASHAVFLLDLNGFKKINDVYGHAVGDEVLVAVGHRLRQAVRDVDTVARFGGDEFAVLATHLSDPEVATSIALRIIESLGPPIDAGSVPHKVGIAIGISLIPGNALQPDDALRMSDVALYRAKSERRSALRFFEPAMDVRVQERCVMENALREALASGHISAAFLPNVSLRNHRIIGFEASPLWQDPVRGVVALERFLEIADEAGLIHELAEHVFRQACAAARKWPADVRLSMDVHPSLLRDPTLPTTLLSILDESGIPPARLELEITESALVADLENAKRILGALRTAGVKVVLDNFGTGYSSLYHLRNFKLDKIKIDRSFVDAIVREPASAGIVNALVGLAHGLGLTISADGIEHLDQEVTLVSSGCEQGQGRYFSRPISAAETTDLFSTDATTSLYVLNQAG